MSKPNGYIIYEGPSQLAGQADVPIVAILPLDSANPKTGPMHQLWILRSDMPPPPTPSTPAPMAASAATVPCAARPAATIASAMSTSLSPRPPSTAPTSAASTPRGTWAGLTVLRLGRLHLMVALQSGPFVCLSG
jgi:hypothetical protein